ncbi:MAG: Na+/H+ antiporter subunit E [Dehalococcoidia bacterium]
MNAFFWNILLALAWTAVTSTVTAGNFALGMLIGFLALVFTQHVPGLPHYTQRGAALAVLVGYTLVEIFRANIRVSRDILRPHQIRPALLSFETRAEGDFELSTLVALITLTPGTTVVDVAPDGRRLLIHFTNLPDGGAEEAIEEVRDGFERRILEALR